MNQFRLIFFGILLGVCLIAVCGAVTVRIRAADIVDLGVITDRDGIEIHKCHTNDLALIDVIHVSPKTNALHGWFETDKPALYLSDLSMIPTGTNIFRVRTLCSGSTSEVAEVTFVIRRPVPKPTFDKIDRFPPPPPMPPGFSAQPLPGATTNQVRWFKSDIRRRPL